MVQFFGSYLSFTCQKLTMVASSSTSNMTRGNVQIKKKKKLVHKNLEALGTIDKIKHSHAMEYLAKKGMKY